MVVPSNLLLGVGGVVPSNLLLDKGVEGCGCLRMAAGAVAAEEEDGSRGRLYISLILAAVVGTM